MNEEAIKVAYDLFVADGYTKSIDDFKLLMDSNEEAVKVAYDLFVADGYTKSIEDFKGLVKKKEDGILAGEDTATLQKGTTSLEPAKSGDDYLSFLEEKNLTEDQVRSAYLEYEQKTQTHPCLLYTSPSPRDRTRSRMPSSA